MTPFCSALTAFQHRRFRQVGSFNDQASRRDVPQVDKSELPEGQHLIEHLALSASSTAVWGAPEGRHAPGWTLEEANLVLDSGRPFGTLLFRRIEDCRTQLVAVRWNNVDEQLHCFVVDRTAPEEDRRRLEIDARSRAAAFMAIHADLGATISRHPAASSDIRAAAHLLPEVNA